MDDCGVPLWHGGPQKLSFEEVQLVPPRQTLDEVGHLRLCLESVEPLGTLSGDTCLTDM